MSFIGQNSYNLAPATGRVGAIAESAKGIHAVAKVASVIVPFGCLSVRDADDLKAKLPTSAAEVLAACKGSGGVAISTHAIVSDGASGSGVPQFPIGKEFAQLRRGPVFVVVEEDVTQGDQAYARYANHIATQNANYLLVGAADQKGAFRKSYDGTAQVDTITPSAGNADVYSVEVRDENGVVIGSASYISDGSGTATEIVTGLKLLLGTIPNITISGTATLILTSSVAGKSFTTTVSANLSLVNTTANAKSAAPCPGMYFKTTTSAGGLAVLDVNLGGN